MRICILENDTLGPDLAPVGGRLADYYERLLRSAGGADWQYDAFNTMLSEYPASFAAYDAVVLTGGRADAFSAEPWVVRLREKVSALLAERQKLVGICFGHQIIGFCLGAQVGRAPAGWG